MTNTNQRNPRYGLGNEAKVARSLRGSGARVEQSAGSRGPADLTAKFGTGATWDVQVKSTRQGTAADLSATDRRRLLRRAERDNATPVVAKVEGGKIHYESARNGQSLKPPKRK